MTIIPFLAALLASPAIAVELPATDAPRAFALGLATLKEHGFGATMRLRANHVALDIAGGAMPVMVLTDTIQADIGLRGDAGPVIFFSDKTARFQSGLRFAGIYDTLMGPGGMAGWVGELGWQHFAMDFGAGVQVLPQFPDLATEHFAIPDEYLLGPTAMVQVYIGLNLLWYLG